MKWFKNLFGNNNDEYKENQVNVEEEWETFIPSQKNKKQQKTVPATKGFKFPIISDEEFKKRTFIGSVSIYEDYLTDDVNSTNFKEGSSISQQEELPTDFHSPIINRRRVRRMTEEQPTFQTERVSRRSPRIREKVDLPIHTATFIKENRTIRRTEIEREPVQHTSKPKSPFKLTEVPSPVFGFKERNVQSVNPNTIVEKITKQENGTDNVYTRLSRQRESITEQENNSYSIKNDINSRNTLDFEQETSTQKEPLSNSAEKIEEIEISINPALTETSSQLNEEGTVSVNHFDKEQLLTKDLVQELNFENQEGPTFLIEKNENYEEEVTKPVFDTSETREEEVEVFEAEEEEEEVTKPVFDTSETREEEVEVFEAEEEEEEVTKPVFEFCEDCEEEVEVFEAVEEEEEEVTKPVFDTSETREEEVEVFEAVEEEEEEVTNPVFDTSETREEEIEVFEAEEEVQEEISNPVFDTSETREEEVEVFEAEEEEEEVTKPVFDTSETREEEVEVVEAVEEEEVTKPVFEYCEDCEEEVEVFEAVEEEEVTKPVFEYCEDCEEEVEVFEAVEEEEVTKPVFDTSETREEEVEVFEAVEEEEVTKPVFEYCEDCEEVEVFEAVEEEEVTKPVFDTSETREEEVEVFEAVEEEEVTKPVFDTSETREEEVEAVEEELVHTHEEEIVQQLIVAQEEVATTTITSTENDSSVLDETLLSSQPKIRPFNVLMTKYDKLRWQQQQERENLASTSNQPMGQTELNNDIQLKEESLGEEITLNEEALNSTQEDNSSVLDETLSTTKPKIRPFNVLMTKYDKLRWQQQLERENLASTSNQSIVQTEMNNDLQLKEEVLEEENAFNEEVLNSTKENNFFKSITPKEENSNEELNVSTEEIVETEDIGEIEKELPFYGFPSDDLLNEPVVYEENEQWLNEREEMLNATFASFNIGARVVHRTQGPSVTRFEVQLDPGVKVNKITNLSDDIQLGLAARDIRIEAPIPGKHTVGIEVPNDSSRPVRISEIIRTPEFRDSPSPLTSVLGLDIEGKPIVTDLKKMPHGLIAGATGSGKSVCINSILVSLLYKADPTDVKLILIDPKMVELAPYNHIPHLVSPVITDVKAATAALKWAVEEMERRYQLFAHTGVREIGRYNELVMESKKYNQKLPYIVVVIDELADLMMVAASDVEDSICRIAQKARACGIHLIIATQRPSVDVITGLIKANVPTRIAFSVSSQVDSRTIIDISGAEKLLGKGDMLFLENGSNKAVRLQGTYVTDEEIEAIVTHCKNERQVEYLFQQEDLLKKLEVVEEEDELFLEACEFIIEHNAASASLLQRKFKIGYNRAARLIDMMESYGYISENRGSKPREVLISLSELKN